MQKSCLHPGDCCISKTEWFDSIGSDKYEFERRLSIVSQIAVEEGDIRLRFVNYTSPYQFILVSDNQVVSTLSSSGATSPNIKEGLTITVLNDCIIKSINGQEIRYNITNG